MQDLGLMSRQAAKQKKRKLECLRVEARVRVGQQLLPGIPDEITINLVAPKLPGTEFHRLSSVSWGWQQPIWNHQIYDARVRSQSTQILVVTNHTSGNHVRALALHSLSDDSFHQLPQFPGLRHNGELPWGCQCISLDGKVYILGGYIPEAGQFGWTTDAVYVLDLAGQQRWKQCTRMQHPRSDFGYGVINGKIYVFGGRTSDSSLVYGSEVYDPKFDTWSPMAPMKYCRFRRHVVTMGEQLFVSNGYVFDENNLWQPLNDPRYDRSSRHAIYDIDGAYSAEVYDPLRNQWRTVDRIREDYAAMLTVGGKLHRLTWRGIEVYYISKNLWKPSQSFSFAVLGPEDSLIVDLLAAMAVDDELLAVVRWTKSYGEYRNEEGQGLCLMKSQGFGCLQREITWQDTQWSLFFEEDEVPFLCAIWL